MRHPVKPDMLEMFAEQAKIGLKGRSGRWDRDLTLPLQRSSSRTASEIFQQELPGRWIPVWTIFGGRPRFLTIPASSSSFRIASRDFLLLNLLRILALAA